MRTTVNLPDDIYAIARSIAAAKQVSLGDAIAELVRKGISPAPRLEGGADDFPCFAVRENAPPITLEATLDAEDAE